MGRDFSGPIIITAIGAIGLASLVGAEFGNTLLGDFEDGIPQATIEQTFDDALVIRDGATHAWNAVRYGLFGETMLGAVPGQDGWLFTDEEYAAPDTYDEIWATKTQLIVDTVAQLDKRGIEVIVVLLPDKSRVAQDKLARGRPPVLEPRYGQALGVLRGAGVLVVDANAALAALHQKTGDAFMARDTHWSPDGARAVAQMVAPQIQALTDIRTSFRTELARQQPHTGDLVKFADAGALNAQLGLAPEDVEVYVTTQTGGASAMDLFADTTIPVTLVGTSYSAISTWNFGGFLMQESQTDILNKAQEGAGPFRPMRDYIDELTTAPSLPDIIVWEIPERYLTVQIKGLEP